MSYVSYTPCTVLADGVPVTIQLEEKDKFRLTKEKLLEKITPKTKVLILPFPIATGSIAGARRICGLQRSVSKKTCFVISGEIYSKLTPETALYDRRIPGNEGAHRSDQRLFKILCDDRMASWICVARQADLKQMLKIRSLRLCVRRRQASMLRSRH